MDKKISGMDLREIDSDILSLGAKKSTQRKGDCEIVLEKTSKYLTNKATLSERQNIVFHLKTGVDCGNIAIRRASHPCITFVNFFSCEAGGPN